VVDLDRVLNSLQSNPGASGLVGAVAGGLPASKSGRRLGKQALQVGGMAAIAGLARAARRRHQRGQGGVVAASASPPQPRSEGFLSAGSPASAAGELDLALFCAMVAAARADGRLDAAERRAPFDHLAKLELTQAARAEPFGGLERSATLDEIVVAATPPERALELYTASRLAIELDSPAERGYLALLGARLDLSDELVASVEREVAADVPAPAAR
jgi:uncharacterized membrane protein YebE (DUF533 family)